MELDRTRQAATLFNQVWDLLDADARSEDDETTMIETALESRRLWREVGTPKNHAISDWQVARVYAAVGDGEKARAFGEMSLALCEAHDLGPFLTGCAHEAIARAHAVAGEAPLARRHIHQATAQAGKIADAEERQLLDDDLADIERTLPAG